MIRDMEKTEKTEKRKKGGFGKLVYLNPKNLQKEIRVYGYHFSWKSHAFIVLAALLGISAVGILFHLRLALLAVVLAVMFCMIPVLVLDMYKKMYEQKRFADAATYMEQILYSFQKSGKVVTALKETAETFEDGMMRERIEEAAAYLEAGRAQTEKGLLWEALEKIESVYPCSKMHMVHDLLVSAEEQGGEMDESILLLLDDLEVWKRRGYELQQKKKVSHTDNIISIVVATILCAVALYVLDAMKGLFVVEVPFDIFQVGVIQGTSFLFILFLMFVFAKSTKSLTRDWLQEGMAKSEAFVLSSYEAVMKYNDAKEKKKSLLFAAPFVVASVPLFLFVGIWAGIIALVIAAFMLLQHRIGVNLAKRDVTEEMYLVLPEWLMEMALLLQNNNVQVSIMKSVPGAPAILRPELLKLVERLREEPGRLSSYTSFCKDFDVPEIQSCMKMLHAVSESGTGDAKIQIHNLLQRVNEMRTQADEIRDKNAAFQVKMIFMYPVLGAMLKLLIDLSVGMVYMMQMLGNMGGV